MREGETEKGLRMSTTLAKYMHTSLALTNHHRNKQTNTHTQREGRRERENVTFNRNRNATIRLKLTMANQRKWVVYVQYTVELVVVEQWR